MNMLNLIKWMLTGYPMYFAGISAAAVGAAATAASAAAGIGTAVSSASSSKKAAKTGAQGAKDAAAIDWDQIQKALDNAGIRLNEDQMQNLAANLQSRKDLQPYANTGRNSLNALSIGMGQGDPDAKKKGMAARQSAQREYQKIIQGTRQKGQQAIRDFIKSPAYSTMNPQARMAAMKQIRTQNMSELQTAQTGRTKYIEDAYQKSQQLPANAGELARNFSVQDYKNDPTTGGNAPRDLTQNFDQSKFMEQGGHNKGDLTRDFNQEDFLAQGGHDIGDLTKNFDQNKFLALGGHDKGDLTKDFDMAAYLASQGKSADALTRDFQASDFQVDPGYQFRIDQGNKGIQGSAAAQGSVLSGAAMKALSRFNQDTASAEYGKVFDRYGQNRSNLQNVAFNQQNQFNQNRGDLNQYLQAATGRFNQNRQDLNQNLTGATGRFNQNRQDLNQNMNSAFDRFNVNRGNAANVYNAAYDRFNNNNTNQFNRLAAIAGMGQNAATNQAGYTQDTAARNSAALQNNAQLVGQLYSQNGARQGEYMTQQANANMAGQVGSANAWNNAAGQVSNSLMQGAYMYGKSKQPNNNNW